MTHKEKRFVMSIVTGIFAIIFCYYWIPSIETSKIAVMVICGLGIALNTWILSGVLRLRYTLKFQNITPEDATLLINKLVIGTAEGKIVWSPSCNHMPGQNSYCLETIIEGVRYSFWGHPGQTKSYQCYDTEGVSFPRLSKLWGQNPPEDVNLWVGDRQWEWNQMIMVSGNVVSPLSSLLSDRVNTEGLMERKKALSAVSQI